ncbi:27203_t:CDS:2 [Gigaspora margarita]|uniref:27203_t:CDS:1 n=1 Tax=Gigaspora margarita TaxID=4874 RepID=A0ABN7VTC1_GIGMA|nr:27203_t:CDS:2 [Gigaspora margarita]
MLNETPTIKTTYNINETYIQMPKVIFTMINSIDLCLILGRSDTSLVTVEDSCFNKIIQERNKLHNISYFLSDETMINKTLTFKLNLTGNLLTDNTQIYLDDPIYPHYNTSLFITPSLLPFLTVDYDNYNDILPSDFKKNSYMLYVNQSYIIYYKRVQRNVIDNNFLSRIGFPSYKTYYYLRTDIANGPILATLNNTTDIYIRLFDNIGEIETEQR